MKKVGYSSLMDGRELPKSDFHFEVLGDLDECSAAIALARSFIDDAGVKEVLKTIQKDLSMLMGQVAGVGLEADYVQKRLTWIEALIADLKRSSILPKGFILPGENKNEALLDSARSISRRAERSFARLAEASNEDNNACLQYLNRVSTLLYLFEIKAGDSGDEEAL
jgi:cob(I)alamin adenosyltransferase